MNNEEQLKTILKKYRLSNPLSSESQELLDDHKKDTLAHILKKNKKYSFLSALLFIVYYAFRKSGHTISLFKSALIISGAVGAIAVSSVIAVYTISSHNRNSQKVQHDNNIVESSAAANNQTIATPDTAKKTTVVKNHYTVKIVPFSHDSSSATIAKEFSSALYKNISSRQGKEYAKIGTANDMFTYDSVLTGTVVKSGSTWIITVKRIDTNARIVFFRKETLLSEADLSDLAKKIAAADTNEQQK